MLIHKLRMEHVIIVAGGKGLRMGADLPKQFLPVGGRPVLMHTLRTFHQYNPLIHIVLVLPTLIKPTGTTCVSNITLRCRTPLPMEAKLVSTRRSAAYAPSTLHPTPTSWPFMMACAPLCRPTPSLAAFRWLSNRVQPYPCCLSPTRYVSARLMAPRTPCRATATVRCKRLKPSVWASCAKPSHSPSAPPSPTMPSGRSLRPQRYSGRGNRENIKLTTPFDLVVGEALLRDRTKQ